MRLAIFSMAAGLSLLVCGTDPPSSPGMQIIWQDKFQGASGGAVNQALWNVADGKTNGNNELERYSASRKNLQLSGGDSVQLVPWKDASADGGWTSGRMETKDTFTPAPGRRTKVQGSIRMGENSNKVGIWPAFWLLGDSVRHGTSWPTCGELDILEQKNGDPVAYGTAHCASCNEPVGRGTTTGTPNGGFHTWALQWDRTPATWQQETITWYRDGQSYYSITGASFDQGTWSTLAHSPYFIVLNVAVGGQFPGNPNGGTMDGYGSMMEVQYVAVYQG